MSPARDEHLMQKTSSDGSAEKTAPLAQSVSHQPAWRAPRAIVLFLAVAAVGLAADLWTKHWAFSTLLDRPGLAERVEDIQQQTPQHVPPDVMLSVLQLRRPLMPGVDITLSTNPGVVFGQPMPRIVVLLATGLTLVMVTGFFLFSPRRDLLVHVALALIIAGAVGNLYDRLFSEVALPGAEPIRNQVRDFVDCSQIGYKWVFNVADVWLVVGVGLIMLQWVLAGRRSSKEPTKAADQPKA